MITGKNADQYKGQLTAITYALLKRYPSMRVDAHPTRRPVTYPKKVFENAVPGVPFPIPKTGNECISNHLMRYNGISSSCKYDALNIDSSGTATLSATGLSSPEWPLYRPENIDKVVNSTDPFWYIKQEHIAPARRAGESLIVWDHVNPMAQGRKARQYLPGQRRVKLATLPVSALGVGIGVDYALYLLSVQLHGQRMGMPLADAYRAALSFTGRIGALILIPALSRFLLPTSAVFKARAAA